MQFASGEPPNFVKRRDLRPEVEMADAHARIALVTTDFIVSVLQDKPPTELPHLGPALDYTKELVTPLIAAMELEGSWHLRPPCNSDRPAPHCPFYPAWPPQDQDRQPSEDNECTCGGTWVETVAQPWIGGLPEVSFVVRDAMHDVRDTEPYVSGSSSCWYDSVSWFSAPNGI